MFVGVEGKETQQKKGLQQEEDSQENSGDRGNAYGWTLGPMALRHTRTSSL